MGFGPQPCRGVASVAISSTSSARVPERSPASFRRHEGTPSTRRRSPLRGLYSLPKTYWNWAGTVVQKTQEDFDMQGPVHHSDDADQTGSRSDAMSRRDFVSLTAAAAAAGAATLAGGRAKPTRCAAPSARDRA